MVIKRKKISVNEAIIRINGTLNEFYSLKMICIKIIKVLKVTLIKGRKD